MSRRPRALGELAHSWIPFGLGQTKPRHYRDMARIAWENRDNLGYAWKVLSRGVCDGCALGTKGLYDWTMDGVHLCMVRLELLRLNTMGPFDPARAADAETLRGMSSKELRDMGRIGWPLRRRRGEAGFTRVGWEELWEEVGRRWRALSPERTAMYVTSRGVTNEVYYVAQKVMRFLGGNNVDNSARLCHSPSTTGLKSTIGVAATTCSYTDWYDAELIVFLGSNPANDQPVAMKYLHEARRRGARVLMVNPYREPGMDRYWIPSTADSALFGTRMTDRFFLVRVGGDLAFLNAVQKLLIERGWIRSDFIEAATEGFESLKAALASQPMEALCAAAGVPFSEVEAFAREIAQADRGIFVWSMGITHHAHGGDTVRGIVNLGLLREYIGRPGTGLMPIRGHSGVQGGAEMGAYSTAFPGGLPITDETARRFSELWGFPVSGQPGLTTVEYLEAAGRGEIDALYCIGGNFLETMPSPSRIEAALARIPLRIHSDIVATSQMLVDPADVVFILPARTRYEQRGGGTETSTERRVIFSPHIPGHEVGEAQSEWEMLLDFASAVNPAGAGRVRFDSGAAIRADIARSVPAYAGIETLAKAGDQFQVGGARLCHDRVFPTADGRAHFQPVAPPVEQMSGAKESALVGGGSTGDGLPDRPPGAPAAARFRLATRRGKQFNSMVQRERDPLTGAERNHIFIRPADASALGLRQDDPILVRSEAGSFRGRVFLAEVAAGTLQAHWPEACVLIPHGAVDPGSGVPDYNAWVTIERSG